MTDDSGEAAALRELLRKKEAELSALLARNDELHDRLSGHETFVRLCAAGLPVLEQMKGQCAELLSKMRR